MFDSFAQLNALVWWTIVLLWLCFAPMITVYVAVRVLRDLRRIANALERAAPVEPPHRKPAPGLLMNPQPGQQPEVVLSAFGRT